MKILIISDVHANLDALEAIDETYDELWMLGDLVNYGPEPAQVVDLIKARASVIISGNHDYAVAHDDDSKWSDRYHNIGEATRRYTSSLLSIAQKRFLRKLPFSARIERDGVRFCLFHAAPSNPLYARLAPDSDQWQQEVEALGADVLLVGHSHLPFIRQVGAVTIINPGSVGQPRAGSPEASYATWENGRVVLNSFTYPVEVTVEKLARSALPEMVRQELIGILRTGRV